MRHLKKRHKLNRNASHRKATLANMAASLIRYERIQTTDAKAKALRPFIEKLLTRAKTDSVQARRLVQSRLRDPDATRRLFDTVAPRMQDRPGGYTRILKLGRRSGDNAPISMIEFVDASLEDVLRLRGIDPDTALAAAGFDYDDDDDDDDVVDAIVDDAPSASDEVAEASAEAEAPAAEEAPADKQD